MKAKVQCHQKTFTTQVKLRVVRALLQLAIVHAVKLVCAALQSMSDLLCQNWVALWLGALKNNCQALKVPARRTEELFFLFHTEIN